MSWYSDHEAFDEYDPPWCRNCSGGDSYEQCEACTQRHMKGEDDDDEEDEDDDPAWTEPFDLCGYEEDSE